MGIRWDGAERRQRDRDPMRDYYEHERHLRRKARWTTFLTIILFSVAAWAVLIIIVAMVALFIATFS